MGDPTPFDPKRAGLLIRDAATVLCGTLLVEFIMEQAVCLERRLKPVLEVLPGVERELEGLECDWRGLREDIETLVEACARSKANPPATGMCDCFAELYGHKKRAYNQLRALKSTIATRVKAAEAAAVASAAAVAAAMDQAGMTQFTLEDKITLVENTARIPAPPSTEVDAPAANSVALEDVSMWASATPEGTGEILSPAATTAPGRPKQKKKKKKKGPGLLEALPERVVYEIPHAEEVAFATLAQVRYRISQWDRKEDQAEAARELVSASAFFSRETSQGLIWSRAACLVECGKFLMTVTNREPAAEKVVTATFLDAATLFSVLLDLDPSDHFLQFDAAESLYWALLTAKTLEPEQQDTARESTARVAANFLRSIHPRRRQYGPILEREPESITYMLGYCLGELAIIANSSDAAAALQYHREVVALPTPPRLTSHGADEAMIYSRHYALAARSRAYAAIAKSHMDAGHVKEAIVAAATGSNTVEMMKEHRTADTEQFSEYFEKILRQAWLVEERRLLKLVSHRTGLASIRKARGMEQPALSKEGLQTEVDALKAARSALKDLEEKSKWRAGVRAALQSFPAREGAYDERDNSKCGSN